MQTLSGHEGAVKCLCFDEWHLLSGSADGLVMAWSMVGKYERCLMAYKHPKYVPATPCLNNVVLSPFPLIAEALILGRSVLPAAY